MSKYSSGARAGLVGLNVRPDAWVVTSSPLYPEAKLTPPRPLRYNRNRSVGPTLVRFAFSALVPFAEETIRLLA